MAISAAFALMRDELLAASGFAAAAYVAVHILSSCSPTLAVRARVLAGVILLGIATSFAAFARAAHVPLTALPGYGIVNVVLALPMFMLLPFAELGVAGSNATGIACIVLGATCALHAVWLSSLLLSSDNTAVPAAFAVTVGVLFDAAVIAHLAVLRLSAGPIRAVAHAVDANLYALCAGSVRVTGEFTLLPIKEGTVRVRVLQPSKAPARVTPTVVIIPDGPAFVEHAQEAAGLLVSELGLRVVIMDMPGFGLSRPSSTYNHSFTQGASAILHILDALKIDRAILHASCVNGFYAIAAAAAEPQLIAGLVLAQTPSVPAMRAWANRIIPLPVTIPVIGQLLAFTMRRSLVARWFRVALPRDREGAADRLRAWTAHGELVVDDGGCNCLAGVVQGTIECDTAALALPASIPVELVWGASDASHKGKTPPESLLELVPHAHVRVLEAPAFNAGHAPTLEYPQTLVDAVSAVLGRVVARPT